MRLDRISLGWDLMMKNKFKRVIGVDVASRKLDLYDSRGKLTRTIENTCQDVERKLIAQL